MTTPRPTVTDPQLVVLADVEAMFGPGGYTRAEGASQAGLKRRSVDKLIDAGHLRRTDTGSSDTDGGRYRLHMTDSGAEQLRRGRAHNLVVIRP